MKTRKRSSARALAQSRLRKLKLILVLLGMMLISFCAVMVWTTYFIVNKTLESAQFIELSTEEIYADKLQNSFPEFYHDLTSENCKLAMSKLITVEAWMNESPKVNLTRLSESCWKRTKKNCENEDCATETNQNSIEI